MPRLNVGVSTEIDAKLEILREEEGRSMSNCIERIIVKHFEDKEKANESDKNRNR